MHVFLWARCALVGAPVVGHDQIAFQEREAETERGSEGPPAGAESTTGKRGGGKAEGEEMEDMREEQRGKREVEVGHGFIGGAEGAVRQD